MVDPMPILITMVVDQLHHDISIIVLLYKGITMQWGEATGPPGLYLSILSFVQGVTGVVNSFLPSEGNQGTDGSLSVVRALISEWGALTLPFGRSLQFRSLNLTTLPFLCSFLYLYHLCSHSLYPYPNDDNY